MSRTHTSTKAPGYEYWSKRPYSRNHGANPGKVSKRLTHRAERNEAKAEVRKQLQEAAE